MKVKAHLQFEKQAQLIEVVLQKVANDPSAWEGGIIYNTTQDVVKWSDGTSWYPIDAQLVTDVTGGNGIDVTDGNPSSIKNVAVDLAASSGLDFSSSKLQIASNGVGLARLAKMNKLKVIGRDHSSNDPETPQALDIDTAIEAKTHDNSLPSTKAVAAALNSVAGDIPDVLGGKGVNVTETSGDFKVEAAPDTTQFDWTSEILEDDRNFKIKNKGVTDALLANDDAVSGGDDNRAVGTDHIKTGAVTEAKIASNAVTQNKIKDNEIGLSKFKKIGKSQLLGRGDQGDASANLNFVPIDSAVETKINNDSVPSTKAVHSAIDTIAGNIPDPYTGGNGIDVDGYSISIDRANNSGLDFAGGKVQIANKAIEFARIQDLTGFSVIGRSEAGAGVTKAINVLDNLGSPIASHDSLASAKIIKEYIDTQVGALGTFRGGWNAAQNSNFPSPDSTGDYWYIDTDGIIQGISFISGDVIIAKAHDSSPTDPADWVTIKTKRGQATTTTLGLVMLASQEDVDTGTNNTKAVTPATLKGHTSARYKDITGSATSFDINHELGTKNVLVDVYEKVNGNSVLVNITRTSVNNVQVGFAVAPGSTVYTVVVHKIGATVIS